VDADDVGRQEIDRLAQHAGLGLDAADAPGHDAKAVDHRRVRIRADQRVRKINSIAFEHALGQIFQIHLVNDTDSRRHDPETVKCLRTPF
jgi:hypothetical protein